MFVVVNTRTWLLNSQKESNKIQSQPIDKNNKLLYNRYVDKT